MNFGAALEAMRDGRRVARQGWNGRGMALELVSGATADDNRQMLPFIAMRTVQGEWVPWLASQTDMLAEDWEAAS
jgi:hypothetical protein